jgi:RNA polymerase sigma-32 factor
MLTCSATADLVQYQRQLGKFPMLQANEEAQLPRRWRENSDREAAHACYGLLALHRSRRAILPWVRPPDLRTVSEGNIGLIQAVKGFDPKRGLRVSTYAIWWINAAIREYILRSWSLVKIGSSICERRSTASLHHMHPEQIRLIAEAWTFASGTFWK